MCNNEHPINWPVAAILIILVVSIASCEANSTNNNDVTIARIKAEQCKCQESQE